MDFGGEQRPVTSSAPSRTHPRAMKFRPLYGPLVVGPFDAIQSEAGRKGEDANKETRTKDSDKTENRARGTGMLTHPVESFVIRAKSRPNPKTFQSGS